MFLVTPYEKNWCHLQCMLSTRQTNNRETVYRFHKNIVSEGYIYCLVQKFQRCWWPGCWLTDHEFNGHCKKGSSVRFTVRLKVHVPRLVNLYQQKKTPMCWNSKDVCPVRLLCITLSYFWIRAVQEVSNLWQEKIHLFALRSKTLIPFKLLSLG